MPDPESSNLLYGFQPLREALRRHPHRLIRVLLARGRGGARRREIEELCRRHRVPVRVAPREELDRLAPGPHNGFVALAHPLPAEEGPEGASDLLVLVEDVQDPRNLGALLRVCEGAGVGRVLIRDRGSAPLGPVAAKAAAGAADWIPVERITNSAATLQRLKEDGFWVYGAAPGGEPPWQVDLSGRVVLCFGGEEKGLRRRTRDSCDVLVGLPMRGRVASLNLATAAAAVLYEALRQRGEG